MDDTETPLFDGFEPPPPKPSPSAGVRLTQRQAANVVAGIHPLTRQPIHPGASREAARDDPRGLAFTCGTCAFRESKGFGYPKCIWAPREGMRRPFVTHGPATDCRAWWPACPQYVEES